MGLKQTFSNIFLDRKLMDRKLMDRKLIDRKPEKLIFISSHNDEIKDNTVEPVSRENLQTGKEYYIESLTYAADEVTMIPNKSIEKLIATFDKLEAPIRYDNGFKFAFFKYYRSVKDRDNDPGYDVQLNLLWRFYEVKKNHIQWQMENRALNIILHNVIGDEYFYIEF